ncbi:MAG TPA: PAS domain S-box protein [Ignavibacteriaceae bacterium]|nr:PAS domain S-box protein [Ignavibacteriaceae bacterium]
MIQNYQKKRVNPLAFKVILLEEEYNFQNILKNIFLKNKIIYQLRTTYNIEAFTSQLKKYNYPDIIIINLKFANTPDRRLSAISIAKKIAPECPILIIADSLGKNGYKDLMQSGVIDIIEKKNEFKLTGIINLITNKQQNQTPKKEIRNNNSNINFNNQAEFFTNNVDSILIAEPTSGDLLEINRAASNLLGFTFDEVKSINIEDILDYPGTLYKESKSKPVVNCIIKLKNNEKKIAEVYLSSFIYKKRSIDAYTLRNIKDCSNGNNYIAEESKYILNEHQENYVHKDELALLSEYNNEAVFVHEVSNDLPGKFIEVNDIACQRLGYEKEELLNVTPLHIDYYSDPEKSRERLEKLYQNKENTFESAHVRKDGQFFPVEINSRMIKYNGKDVVISTVKDISDKKYIESKLIESERRYKSLFKINPVPLFVVRLEDLTIMDVNDAVEVQYGYTKKELFNKSILELLSPSCKAKKNNFDIDLFCKDGDCKHIKKDGTEIDVNMVSQDFIVNNTHVKIISAFNITEKSKAEKVLLESEIKFRQLVEQAVDGILVVDDKGVINLVNSKFCKMYGLRENELINTDVKEIFNTKIFIKNFNDIIKAKKEKNLFFEDIILTKENKNIEVEISLKKRHDGYIQGFIRDISKKKKAEKDLILLQTIIKASSEAVVISDPAGNIIYHNSSYKNLLGENNSVNVFAKLEQEFPEESVSYIKDEILPTLRKERAWSGSFEVYDKTKTNKIPVWCSLSVITDKDNNPEYVLGFLHDLSLKKSMDIELRKLFKAVEQSPVSIILTDTKGNIEYVNPKFCELTGYSPEEVYGNNPKLLKSGKMSEEEYKVLWNTILEGREWRGEFLNKKKSGELYWEFASISAIKDDEGKITNFLAVKEDISERKKAEEIIRNSLHEKETLLKEIHHRVKNNLQIVSSLLSLQADYVADDFSKELFNDSKNRIKSMGLIHERLYQSNMFSQIDFAEYINELANHLLRTYKIYPELIRLELKLDKEFISIEDAIPCGLIINELISNALKYSCDGTNTVTISISFKKDKKGNYVLTISDNGVGIPKDVDLENSKTLGLQLVNDLVLQLDGKLNLNRTKGTKFTIKF